MAGSGSSSRLPENNPSRQSLVPSVPRPQPLSNGTGGYFTDYRTYPTAYGVRPTTGSRSSGRSNASVPRSQESYLATSPQPGGMGVPGPSGSPRGSRDEDARAYRNAKIAMAALPAHLQPDYGEGFLRIDPDGVVKSGTLEALVERLTVDPLKRSQETAYRMTFLMTYRSFTDGITVFELLVERYLMDNPPGLNEEQFTEWKEKRLRPAQTRVLTTFNEWVERYRFVKDEAHIVPKLKKFLSDIKTPPKNALTAKLLLQTIEKHEVAAATTAAASLHPVMTESSASGLSTSPSTSLSSKKSLKLSITASSGKQKAPKSDLLKFGYEELALHLTLVEYRLYAK
ncbi:hypothetical protein FRB99_005683 [Tulasnella sp. 403]|nr:hypothetical protein FRB99_005683 [Tulasnella sp. 403]